jgi:hypothetical protein
MGGSIAADKKSCRKLHDRSMLTESNMCAHCSDVHSKGYGSTFFLKNKHFWQGKCHQLDQTSSSFDNPSNTSTTKVKQNRAEERFRASPVEKCINHHAAAQKRRKLALQRLRI